MSFIRQLARLICAFLRFLPAWFGKRLLEPVFRNMPSAEGSQLPKVTESPVIVYRVNLNTGRYSRIDPNSVSSI